MAYIVLTMNEGLHIRLRAWFFIEGNLIEVMNISSTSIVMAAVFLSDCFCFNFKLMKAISGSSYYMEEEIA